MDDDGGLPMTDWNEAALREMAARMEAARAAWRTTTLTNVERATRSPFHILVSCVISLRTKDEVTAQASERLFSLAQSPAELEALPEEIIAKAIYPAGFYNTKARQLREIARILVQEHGGQVPPDEEALLALPGVGRKTMNLVLGLGFGIPAICVDTHVHRISNRLGLVETTTPAATERALQELLPEDLWIPINDLMVTFGQNQCHPTSPRCSTCSLADLCDRRGVTRSR